MELAEQQSEQLAELESARGMSVEIYWPRLSDDSVWNLGQWAEKLQGKADAMASWLHSQVVQEIYRRASEKPIDVKACRLPVSWTDEELADALGGVFGLIQSNQNRELDDFFHKLAIAVVVQCQSRLKAS